MRKLILVTMLCFSLASCSGSSLVGALTGGTVETVAKAVPSALNELQEIVDEATPDGGNQKVKVGNNSVVTTSQRPVQRNKGLVADNVDGDVVQLDGGNKIENVDGDIIQNIYEIPWHVWALFGVLLWIFWELPRSSTIYAWISKRIKAFRKQRDK